MSPDSAVLAALQAWLNGHPSYTYTTVAEERSAAGNDVAATLRVTFDGPANTETVHVERGTGAGTDIRWSGCFAANVQDVRVASSAEVIELREGGGVRCGDEYGDGATVTEDRLTFDPADGQPLMRER